jgi:hypothetical protein
MLLIEGQISRNEDGSPIFEMEEIVPDFGYRPDAFETAPPPFTGRESTSK